MPSPRSADRHADVTHAVGQRRVVLVRQAQEFDAVLAKLANRSDDVLGAQGDVLDRPGE